jgi:GT2 family glycosyltransferase
MMPTSTDLAVVAVNYRSHQLLAHNLAPLAVAVGAHVVVVDNWSDADERDALHRLADQHGWQVIDAPNDGFGAGVNLAVAAALDAGAHVLAVLNPDLTLTPDHLLALVADVRADPLALAGPQIVDSTGRASRVGGLDWRRGRTTPTGPHPVWLSGACLVVSAQLWCTLGGFADGYGMYWEDVDLCVRATNTGARLVHRRDLSGVHDAGGTQDHAGTRRKSDLYYRANCRGRLVFAAQHLRWRARGRWVWWSAPYAWSVVLQGGRRQLVRSLRPLLAVISGTLAGIAYLLRHPVPTAPTHT